MSVKELSLYDPMIDIAIIVANENNINFKIKLGMDEANMTVSRNQAHLCFGYRSI